MKITVEGQKFELGQVVFTPGALDLFGIGQLYLSATPFEKSVYYPYLARHATGDWGSLSDADRQENELSLKEGFRLLSCYHIHGKKLWIITEHDRSVTTLLLPSEY